jgi:hypothetical protein
LANVYSGHAFRATLRHRNPRASVDLQARSIQVENKILQRRAFYDRTRKLDHVSSVNTFLIPGVYSCIDAIVFPQVVLLLLAY